MHLSKSAAGIQPINPLVLLNVRRVIGWIVHGCSCGDPASYVFTSAAILEQIVLQILGVTEQIPAKATGPSLKHRQLCLLYVHNRGNNRRDLNGTIQWQHELSTKTTNEGAPLCAQHYNLCVGKAPLGPLRSGSAWVQSNTLFTKYHQADRAKPTNLIKLLKGLHLKRRVSVVSSYRVCPLQLKWERGGVWKMPSFHSPPGSWHRLGMRGHGGTAASSINRKWVWLQNGHCALFVIVLSQQTVERKKKEKKL